MRRFMVLILILGLSVIAAAACTTSTPPKTITTPNYRLHFTTTTTAPRPLVMVLGASGRALADIVRVQGQDAYADQQGYVVAYLQAPPNTDHTWATGYNSSPGGLRNDLPYLLNQLALMKTSVSIDPHRIYLEGWSNGGFFALRAALWRTDLFAAAGEIEAVLDVSYSTRNPIRVLHIHSTRDTVVPIEGGNSPLLESSMGHPVDLRNSYTEGAALPPGSTWKLVTGPGSGPGYHDYDPAAAAAFWTFFRDFRR
jgi:poly(3-hydroxybutyrate) depolymerase